MACLLDGRSVLKRRLARTGSIILFLGLLSCNGHRVDQSLNPGVLFSTGSGFLHQASTMAIKGSIEFKSGVAIESGSFQLFLNGPDSLSFLIEGPFKVDLFRLVIVDQYAYAISRDDRRWYRFNSGDPLEIPEYGVDKLIPHLLGTYIFPQYYLRLADFEKASNRLILSYENTEFYIQSGAGDRSFLLISGNTDIITLYSHKDYYKDGFYPSQVEIFDKTESWRISLEIDKIRINPSIPAKLWLRGR